MEMTATQQFTASIAPKDRKGRPAQVDGTPSWAVSDETIIQVVPAANGMSAIVVAQGPGTANLNVNADADLGNGVEPLIGTMEVTVTPGKATVIEITAAQPEEQP